MGKGHIFGTSVPSVTFITYSVYILKNRFNKAKIVIDWCFGMLRPFKNTIKQTVSRF